MMRFVQLVRRFVIENRLICLIAAAILGLALVLNFFDLQSLVPMLLGYGIFGLVALLAHRRAKRAVSARAIVVVALILLAAGLVCRLWLLGTTCINTGDHMCDADGYYDAARLFAEGQDGAIKHFPALFPYVASYEMLLGSFMKLVGTGPYAFVLLNTLLDLGAAALIFLLGRELSGNRTAIGLLGAGLWFVCPIGIAASASASPVVAVNCLILASFVLIYYLVQARRSWRRSLPFALLLGLVLGLLNSFRPIALIIVIALAIYFAMQFFAAKPQLRKFVQPLVVLGLIGGLVMLVNAGFLRLVDRYSGLTAARNSGGWTLLLGANAAANGKWNPADANLIAGAQGYGDGALYTHELDDAGATQAELARRGLERYLNNTDDQNAALVATRAYNLLAKQEVSTDYWFNQQLDTYQKPLRWLTSAFIAVVLLAAFLYLRRAPVDPTQPTVVYTLVLIGFFLAMLLVETHARYSTIFLPTLVLLATLSFGRLGKERQK